MRRVVITGIGIVSSIGNNKKEVLASLYKGVSGIVSSEEMKKLGMRSAVWGNIKLESINIITQKLSRFMNNASRYSFVAMMEAIKDAKIDREYYQKNPRVGLISGSGCSFSKNTLTSDIHLMKNKHISKGISPYLAVKTMPSGISACLSTLFKIYGVTYSISSACATSAHCIGNAFELIQFGRQDLIFAGGGEEISLELAMQFDAMRALSTCFNNDPKKASRVYDVYRDGFVISGGAGMLVIEELNSALSRSAYIYAEIIGYAATSDGSNIVVPSGDGAIRCMNLARKGKNIPIDYLNVHGTGTKIGDLIELEAIRKVFLNEKKPMISATKSMTGHGLGASGVHEMIYTLLMLKYNFIAPTINIENLEPCAENMNIIQKTTNIEINTAMSNSFGFGGTNVSLIVKKY
ncbi:3-oxoacyl-ACP synthase I [Buchnera aphidicola str. APS (Acyrthosiphon pisum)]|uniref:3-oxoacyl-[acyl-carrier-protein] synthase 1 n=2 Tax=Buchnera aphidicola TaxID=9 RepID=FABB_BUCAI|nr:3-oxoacyl-ACP synthase I [Buchnera aphidicola]P57193.1 RecName: Full=3-oxoacyl-[acyl-carrier-protein] synthase 1; AltName: Full=3-oxoacyl-[acyl-carrier-protein] synthase I; AltName: Full=Beta-ketoacyl-ACP synthase I; Short=KAS I [Buchnera aphidicola str. APS (Acyrthosiphon pisum)]pir/C84940/ 3-oxoacyl-[acyl-carrier-protein] synthase (EC 2.3.1.41) I [imported] - Buchnera sp. (strain APS) [Buchnera sp. (in: enterobacteria)]ADP67641.1 3-oxoacyl-[acyl-carrier-protein] synthase I [Buchnera aphidic